MQNPRVDQRGLGRGTEVYRALPLGDYRSRTTRDPYVAVILFDGQNRLRTGKKQRRAIPSNI